MLPIAEIDLLNPPGMLSSIPVNKLTIHDVGFHLWVHLKRPVSLKFYPPGNYDTRLAIFI